LNRDWQPSEHRMVRLRSKYCTGGARACSKLRLMRAQSSPSIQLVAPLVHFDAYISGSV